MDNPAPAADLTATCLRHQQPAVGPCSRCGTFRCAQCGDSTLCVACTERNVEAPWFGTSIKKMVVLQIASFGIYAAYWSYQQWKKVKANGADVWPIPRAIFLGFTSFDLFPRIAAQLEVKGLAVAFNPRALAVWVLLSNFTFRLPDPLWILGLLQIIPLIMVQRGINTLNASVAPAATKNDRFTGANIVLIAFGAALWLLILIGTVMPDPPP